jgi:hypothetical protein
MQSNEQYNSGAIIPMLKSINIHKANTINILTDQLLGKKQIKLLYKKRIIVSIQCELF